MYYLLVCALLYFSCVSGWRFEACSKTNFQGDCGVVEGRGCVSLLDLTWSNEVSMHDSINSLKSIDDTCIRFYENINCKGRSQAFYNSHPNALKDLAVSNFANTASSAGPCLEYECAYKNSNHGEFDCVSHDSIYFGEKPSLKTIEVKEDNNPIVKYQRGFNDRVEYLLAKIKTHHLNRGSKPDSTAKAYAAKMGKPGDVPGLIIGEELGGSGSATYNIFPQNGYIANSMYHEILDRNLYALASRNGEVWWEVNLHYDDESSTRPSALVYVVNPIFFEVRHLPNPIYRD